MGKAYRDPNAFGIIGYGRFGATLAQELLNAGKEVIILDNVPDKLEKIKQQASHVYVITEISKDAFIEAGLEGCGTVIVCIGRDVEGNILATLNAKELGVPRVISKASSADHARVLRKLGAEVVFPEEDMGRRLAKTLCMKEALDWLPLCDDFSIVEIQVGQSFDEKNVLELDLRKKWGINIIALVHQGKATGMISPDTVLHVGDQMVIAGTNKSLAVFQKRT
ncbi:MAG: TrkA family potassium uptake protein [Sphaerochaeta sp.]|jgi:trk system potassium uptake protein TrkA|nr:TrkA family potassium uptake protein [Sphaerochaeta sp.]